MHHVHHSYPHMLQTPAESLFGAVCAGPALKPYLPQHDWKVMLLTHVDKTRLLLLPLLLPLLLLLLL